MKIGGGFMGKGRWDFGDINFEDDKRERKFVQLGVQERAFTGINEIEIDGKPKFLGTSLTFEIDENGKRD